MIWRRLKKYDLEQEAKRDSEDDQDEVHVSFRERLLMILTAYAVILVPCLLVLVGLCLLAGWLFGLL